MRHDEQRESTNGVSLCESDEHGDATWLWCESSSACSFVPHVWSASGEHEFHLGQRGMGSEMKKVSKSNSVSKSKS